MRCLKDVGMLSTTPINYNGQEIVPIQFLKALLPDPASLGPRTKGKTNIGCIFTGVRMDRRKPTIFIIFVTIRNAIRRLEARQSATRQVFQPCVGH